MRITALLSLSALLLLACGEDKPDTGSPVDTDPGDTDDRELPDAPCSDGSWPGGWDDAAAVVHVQPLAGEGADGSPWAPYPDLNFALHASTDQPALRVALWPGSHEGVVQVKQGQGALGSHSITIAGCSAEETSLVGAGGPPLALYGPGRVSLSHVTLRNRGRGDSALAIRDGAQATVEDVEVEDARGRGITIVGADTVATLRRVSVRDTGGHAGQGGLGIYGWGISSVGAHTTLEQVSISGSGGTGLFADRGDLEARELTIVGRVGFWGQQYGINLLHMARVSLSDCSVTEASGVGILLVDVQQAQISDCVVTGTLPFSNPGAQGDGGDGIVLSRAFRPAEIPTRGSSSVSLRDNILGSNARLGIGTWGVDLELSGNVCDSNGYEPEGSCIYVGGEVTVSGEDPWLPLDRALLPIGQVKDRHGIHIP